MYGHANGETVDDVLDRGGALRRAGLPGGPGAVRHSRAGEHLRGRQRTQHVLRAGRRGPSDRDDLVDRALPRPRADACSHGSATEFGPDLRLLHDVHHRLTPIEAARLGRSLEPYRSDLARGPGAGRAAGGLPADPAAHHHPDRGRRGLQHHLGLPAAHHRAAHRLHPDHRRTRRRHHPPAPHLRPGRAAPRPQRLPRRHRPVPRLHGGRPAPGHRHPQLRAAGVHAPHRRRPTPSSRTATASPTATCTPPRSPASVWTSTRPWPPSTPTSPPRCR